MSKAANNVKSRNEPFVDKYASKLWHESPSSENPYVANQRFCAGYELQELMQKRSYADVVYLAVKGELPSKSDSKLLESLMIALVSPGPRHNASRAAMIAGVGKSLPEHTLPVSMMLLAGSEQGSGVIDASIRFIRKAAKKSPEDIFTTKQEMDFPGFGCCFGSHDEYAHRLIVNLASSFPDFKLLKWASDFSALLHTYDKGILPVGVAAAVFAELGVQPRFAPGLFQLMAAPGLLSHGVEFANKPRTDWPFVSDENYIIEP